MKALNAYSCERLLAELGGNELSDEEIEVLFQLMERCGRLFFRAANAALQKDRDAFLDALTSHFSALGSAACLSRMEAFRLLVRQIEDGYADVAHGLATAKIAAYPPERQLVAVLQRAGREGDILRTQTIEALGRRGLSRSGDIVARDADGQPFVVDGTISAFVENLGVALKLLAKRYDPERSIGPFRVPLPAGATETEIYEAGTSLLNGGAFRRWRRLEERRRYWGGTLVEHRPPHMPAWIAKSIEVVREYRPLATAELLDWVANERYRAFLLRQARAVRFESGEQPVYAGLAPGVPLAPTRFVCLSEKSAHVALTGLFGNALLTSGKRFAGLTLPEWLRGYAALGEIARAAYDGEPRFGCRSLVLLDPEDLEKQLADVGLPPTVAKTFIAHATLADRSDDMFDCPLLATDDGRLLLFALAAVDVDLTRVVLSNLASLGEHFVEKGPSFEREVMRFFAAMGLQAFAVKTVRDGEPYQIDVVVIWEDHLFLIECKHETLSGLKPIAAYNFEQRRRDHLRQALRLLDGVRKHPDMIEEVSGVDPTTKQCVPVLLYAFPFAAPDLHEGVLVCDWSSITRFFRERTINKVSVDVGRPGSEPTRRPTYALWEGERPTVSDFCRQLRDPIQVRQMVESASPDLEQIWLTDHRYAATYVLRQRVPGMPRRGGARKAPSEERARTLQERAWRETRKRRR